MESKGFVGPTFGSMVRLAFSKGVSVATKTDARYEWVLMWKDSQTDERGRFYGHSFWFDKLRGRVSIKDMSGDFPHETDDGVLWLDTSRPMEFWMDGGKMRASIPVVGGPEGREKSYCIMVWKDAVKAARQYGFKVTLGKSVAELAATVFEVASLSMERAADA